MSNSSPSDHIAAHVSLVNKDAEAARLLGAEKPVVHLFLIELCKANLKAAQVDAVCSGSGALVDGIIWSRVETSQLERALSEITNTLKNCIVPLEFEVAYFDVRDGIWRHFYPADGAEPFERHLTPEAKQVRESLNHLFTEAAERICDRLRAQ